MRLQPLALAFSLALPVDAAAAWIEPSHRDHQAGRLQHSNGYPILRWLRDTAVEAFFGKQLRDDDLDTYEINPAVAMRHEGGIVVRFNATTLEQKRLLTDITRTLQAFDIWSISHDYVDARIYNAKIYLKKIVDQLPDSMKKPEIMIYDLPAAIWATYPKKTTGGFSSSSLDVLTSREGMGNLFFKDYQRLSVVTSWMRLLEAMFPSLTEMTSIGKSFEGRDIHALRVGARNEEEEEGGSRKAILVTGGLHGREWISTSTVTYLMWSMVTAYDKDPMVTKLLDKFDIIFIPILNPDGYEYTWQEDRLWRKSRQDTGTSFCFGMDLDHAFGYEWATNNKAGPCSENYGGDSPFHAVEASELANWAKNQTAQHGVKFVGFLDMHSYSQQILFPYSYTCAAQPPNLENLMELGVGLAKAIRLSSGEAYTVTSACESATAYRGKDDTRVEGGGGSAIDWFYHEIGAKYSYQIKLRDTGSYGFLLPADHIVPTGEEVLNALKYFGDFLLGNNGIEKGEFEGSEHVQNPPADQWSDLKRRR
ncbi:putative metallocarboxypeptidase ecm14 [Podospora pseudoanserina]|uniref:Inactive metallocarboxypeptidase ECM14 n=1 Tax=Podospora pseudoanserina TaxID=2609844 RepID=A0ABR0IGN6_9PEZI|nr:putative metallocarboxypeptidase ecm14 [Podospora pseudoanserina]